MVILASYKHHGNSLNANFQGSKGSKQLGDVKVVASIFYLQFIVST